MTERIINDWAPETRSLLRALIAAGFKIEGGNNGEDKFEFQTEADFIANLTACDESHLYFSMNGNRGWIYLVYGNSPGELACDYSYNLAYAEALDEVTDAHYAAWSERKQPTKKQELV